MTMHHKNCPATVMPSLWLNLKVVELMPPDVPSAIKHCNVIYCFYWGIEWRFFVSYGCSVHFVTCCKKCFNIEFVVKKDTEFSDVDSLVMTIFITLMKKSHKTHVVHGFCAILKITQNLGWKFFSAVKIENSLKDYSKIACKKSYYNKIIK